MTDDALNPNFEWKKKSIGKKERLSRRIDSNQTLLFEKKKKNDFSQALSITANNTKNNGNINLLRKRVKEALDDDYDEDDEWIFDALNLFNFEMEFGDVFYSLLSLADEAGLDAEECLNKALSKYQERMNKKNNIGSGR